MNVSQVEWWGGLQNIADTWVKDDELVFPDFSLFFPLWNSEVPLQGIGGAELQYRLDNPVIHGDGGAHERGSLVRLR